MHAQPTPLKKVKEKTKDRVWTSSRPAATRMTMQQTRNLFDFDDTVCRESEPGSSREVANSRLRAAQSRFPGSRFGQSKSRCPEPTKLASAGLMHVQGIFLPLGVGENFHVSGVLRAALLLLSTRSP